MNMALEYIDKSKPHHSLVALDADVKDPACGATERGNGMNKSHRNKDSMRTIPESVVRLADT